MCHTVCKALQQCFRHRGNAQNATASSDEDDDGFWPAIVCSAATVVFFVCLFLMLKFLQGVEIAQKRDLG